MAWHAAAFPVAVKASQVPLGHSPRDSPKVMDLPLVLRSQITQKTDLKVCIRLGFVVLLIGTFRRRSMPVSFWILRFPMRAWLFSSMSTSGESTMRMFFSLGIRRQHCNRRPPAESFDCNFCARRDSHCCVFFDAIWY